MDPEQSLKQLLLLICSIFLAQASAETEHPPDPATPPSMEALHAQWERMGPEILFEAAQTSHERGELEDALSRLTWLSSHHASAKVRLELGEVLELVREYEAAIIQYELLVESWPESPEAPLAYFRRVLCLQDLNEHRHALRAIKRLARREALSEEDTAVVALLQGSSEIALGRSRRGVARTNHALSQLESTDRAWHRARAHAWLMRHLIRESRRLSLKRERLSLVNQPRRIRLLELAEVQLSSINRLQIPEFTVEGFLILGIGLEELSVDFAAVKPSRRSSPEEKASLMGEVEQFSAAYLRGAWALYDKGLEAGIRNGVKGPIMDEIRTRRDAIGPGQGSTGRPATD